MRTDTRWRLRRVTIILIAFVAAVAFLNAIAVGVVAVAPADCTTCHRDEVDSLRARGHASVDCARCHVPTTAGGKVRFAVDQLYGMHLPLRTFSGREVSEVPDRTCSSCHGAIAEGVAEGAIRMNHAECSAGRSRTDCHSRVGHGDGVQWARTYDMFDCLSCHMRKGSTVDCESCHTPRSREERVKTGTFAVVHGSNWRRTHGMGDALACGACHSSEKCAKCHGPGVPHASSFRATHGQYAASKGARCQSCHVETFCSDCHGVQMPHPKAFAAGHSAFVKKEGRKSCENCHHETDCTTCHELHVHPGNAGQVKAK